MKIKKKIAALKIIVLLGEAKPEARLRLTSGLAGGKALKKNKKIKSK